MLDLTSLHQYRINTPGLIRRDVPLLLAGSSSEQQSSLGCQCLYLRPGSGDLREAALNILLFSPRFPHWLHTDEDEQHTHEDLQD